jgi:monoamine oxidase
MLGFFACFEGWAQAHRLDERFADGAAQIPRRLAERLGGRVVTSCPVRRIVHGKEGVLVEHDACATRAEAVIVAMEPGQRSRRRGRPAGGILRQRAHVGAAVGAHD